MKRILGLITSSGARDTYVLTAGNLADSLVAFLFTVICFKLLTSSDFGLFSAFNNLIFSASMVLDLGISQALLYYLPHQKDRGKTAFIGSAIALRIITATIFALILAIISPYVSIYLFPGSSVSMVFITSLAIIINSLIDVLVFSLQGLHKFFTSVIISNTFSLSRLLIVMVFLTYSWPFSVNEALLITLSGPLLGIFIGIYLLKPLMPVLDLVKKLLNFSSYMGIYRICQIITLRSDVQIVLASLGSTAAGSYSVAARMGNFYPLIIITLNSLFSSRLRLLNDISSRFFRKSLFLIIAIIIGMLICAWQAPLIIKLLFGTKASNAGIIYRYLTLAYIPLVAATFPIAILVFRFSKTKFMGILGIIQVSTMLVLSSFLTTNFQQFGPIIGLTVANSLVLILSCYKVFSVWK